MAELEGKGVDYERFALRFLFRRFIDTYALQSVLEIPASGEKAMPSLYSLAFGEAGCAVTLVNGVDASMRVWNQLGYPPNRRECADLTATGMDTGSHDLVWTFVALARHPDKDAFLKEMLRISRHCVLYVGVNRFNPGFLSHRCVHRLCKVPWDHGDVTFMNPFVVSRFFREHGLRNVKVGAVDTPPYPDSLGFRDMRLHRKNVDLNAIEWDSRTIRWMQEDRYPLKIKALHCFERFPAPLRLKLFYAHLFYVIAEKRV